MASFEAKTGRERLRMWEKKILVLIHSNPTRNREFQKNSIKIKKLKNIIMASSDAKNGWDRLRMGEKEIVPISSKAIQNIEFRKNSKKIQKIKKHQ